MTTWAEIIIDTPKVIQPRDGFFMLEGGAQTFPEDNLNSASWRTSAGIVELIRLSYSKATQTHGAISYVDNGNGTWSETATLSLRPDTILADQKINAVLQRKEQVMRGGITVLTEPVSTLVDDTQKIFGMELWRKIPGNVWPANVSIFTLEGKRINVNESQFETLVTQVAEHFYLTDNNADAHIAAIEALRDASNGQGIIDYDFSTGWPANPVLP